MNKEQSPLGDLRTDFVKGELSESDLSDSPLLLFRQWLDAYMAVEPAEPTAMTLCTADADGQPSSRVVLLKGLDEGFCFFTNYESQKGQELAQNPKAAINFFWPELERQVSVSGVVEKMSVAESEQYFHSRPKGSQVGAVVSQQSRPLESRDVLDAKMAAMTAECAKLDAIPLPEHWGGYRLIPSRVSFWQGRSCRLHDRFEYLKIGRQWRIQRLYP